MADDKKKKIKRIRATHPFKAKDGRQFLPGQFIHDELPAKEIAKLIKEHKAAYKIEEGSK